MTNETDGLDPFHVAVHRSQLSEVADRRAASAATAPGERMTDIEAARAIARVLDLAAKKVGVTQYDGMDDFLLQILARARGGGLDPVSYRIAWTLAHPPRKQSGDVTSAPA